MTDSIARCQEINAFLRVCPQPDRDDVALYVLVDSDGEPYYVGWSHNPIAHFLQHRHRSNGSSMLVLMLTDEATVRRAYEWLTRCLFRAGHQLLNGTGRQMGSSILNTWKWVKGSQPDV